MTGETDFEAAVGAPLQHRGSVTAEPPPGEESGASAGLKGAFTTPGQDASAVQARRLPSAGNGHLCQNLVKA